MLESIGIRNFALLEKASLKFSSGFNVITGETGAGKSILIGALNMVLGERVGREIVRPGEKFCEVEAVFAPPFPERVIKFLKDMELDETELFLRRIFEAEGRSRCFINDRSVTLSSLKGLGDMLVDIHSQNQHQELLNPSRQLNLLDLYGGSAGLRKEAVSAHGKLVDLHKKREELILREEETSREAERLRHEIREIDALELSDTFEEELEADYKRLLNSGRLAEGAAKLYAGMYESDGALFEQLSEFGRISLELSGIDSGFTPVNSAIQKALFEIETAANILRERVSPEDNPQARLEEVSGQKDQLISLKLKFGPEVEDILKYRQEIGRRISEFESFTEKISKLDEDISISEKKLKKLVEELFKKRESSAGKLSKEVSQRLKSLGMSEAQFNVIVEKDESGASGGSNTRFMVKTNPGSPEMDLRKVASGGEISRIMLAIKSSLADVDDIPVLVFDEIDAGIGSDTASAVAEEMKRLSEYHALITVTHLPPIAAAAEKHIRVNKTSYLDTTITEIENLDDEGRLKELSRMLGGEEDSAALIHAEELRKRYEKQKK